MELKAKIIEVHPDRHQIVVRYYTDDYPPVAVGASVRGDGSPVRCHTDRAITIREVPMPTGDALLELIADNGTGVATEVELHRQVVDVRKDTSMAAALALVDVELVLPNTARVGGVVL